jgi:hypothetical protein
VSFDLMTQELYQLLPTMIHTQESDKHGRIELKLKMKSSHENEIARALVRVDLKLTDGGRLTLALGRQQKNQQLH